MKIEVNIQKKYAYIIIGLLVLLIGGVGVWAYGTSNPSNFGHTWNEIANKPDLATEDYVDNKGFDMSNAPSGTHCGVYMMTQSKLQAYEPCLGHNPKNSCPSGFKRADLGYFEAGGGTRKYVYCIKK